jgi:hypothetical protein
VKHQGEYERVISASRRGEGGEKDRLAKERVVGRIKKFRTESDNGRKNREEKRRSKQMVSTEAKTTQTSLMLKKQRVTRSQELPRCTRANGEWARRLQGRQLEGDNQQKEKKRNRRGSRVLGKKPYGENRSGFDLASSQETHADRHTANTQTWFFWGKGKRDYQCIGKRRSRRRRR